ncbi:MAG: hypothetical protein ACREPW_10150 [Candidatus Binataceae bacterium]
MWKPGESGNPSGVRKDMSTQPSDLSGSGARTRRWRQRKRAGVVVVSVEVPLHLTSKLARLGWLRGNGTGDKPAIADALVEAAERAMELKVSPVRSPEQSAILERDAHGAAEARRA